MNILDMLKGAFNASPKTNASIVPVPDYVQESIKQDGYFNYNSFIQNETQLYRIRTTATQFRSALTLAENPQQRNRFNLLQVYQNIALDPYIQGLIRQRFLSVLAQDFSLVSPRGKVLEDETKELVDAPWFREFMQLAHESLFWGFSFIQLGDVENGDLKDVTLIPRQYCRPDFGIISSLQQGNSGISVYEEPVSDWVVPVYKDCHDLGLFKEIAMLAFMKQNSEIGASAFLERYGQPWMIAKTDSKSETRTGLMQMLANFGKQPWAVIPDTVQLETVSATGGTSDYLSHTEYVNGQLAIAILGQTLTSSAQKYGTEALGKIHTAVLDDIIKSDIAFLQQQFNDKMVPKLAKLGILPANSRLLISRRQTLGEVLEAVSTAGYQLTEQYLADKLGIPVDAIKTKVETIDVNEK